MKGGGTPLEQPPGAVSTSELVYGTAPTSPHTLAFVFQSKRFRVSGVRGTFPSPAPSPALPSLQCALGTQALRVLLSHV